MTNLIIDTINKQAKEKKQGIEFSNINKNTTANDYKERGNDSDSNFKDDDKSYETSDDSTIDGNNNLPDDPNYPDKNQHQHFNVLEINDIDEDNLNSKNKGMGDEGVGEEDNPIQNDGDNGDADSTRRGHCQRRQQIHKRR